MSIHKQLDDLDVISFALGSSIPEVAENSNRSVRFAYTHLGVGLKRNDTAVDKQAWQPDTFRRVRLADHFSELFLVDNINPKLARFDQFASRILTGEQVIGLFAHACGDASTVPCESIHQKLRAARSVFQ